MLSRRVIYSIFFSMTIFLSIGCNAQERKDVYKKFPIGTTLTVDILRESEQIVPNGSELILVYNISDQWDYFDPHLLFFDDSLKLYAASYFPSEKIESLNDNVIVCYLNAKRNRRRHQYRSDLPEKYRLSLTNLGNGHGRKSDKVIEEIEIDSIGTTAILHIKQSQNAYIGLRGKKLFADSSFLENFVLADTLIFPISKLSFRYKENTVSISEITSNDRLRWDYMLVPEKSILEDFYHDIFKSITE